VSKLVLSTSSSTPKSRPSWLADHALRRFISRPPRAARAARRTRCRRRDALIVGAGHNGLTCAAYLARAGKRVLVLESRERIGGACTIEEPWPGVRLSPCAYLAGLLHPLVIEELNLGALGYSWSPASNGLFVPFEDGSSIQLYDDEAQCEAEVVRFSPHPE